MKSSEQLTLSTEHLGKRYKRDFWGIRDFNLTLTPGITGLLGPNGAGKSTLMRMLATISRPTEGTINWNGKDVQKHPNDLRAVLGYLPQDFGVYPHLNACEFLDYMAAIKGLSAKSAKRRIDELIIWLNLQDAAKRPLGGYSGGMRQRVGIAQALLNDPLLLIIDEPTVGLDPAERVRFRQLLTDLATDRIILFSTHIVTDIEATANEIVVMNKGSMLMKNTPANILKNLDDRVWEMEIDAEKVNEFKQRFLVSSISHKKEKIVIRLINEKKPSDAARPVDPNLEDIYLYSTQR